jgi:hypothetical protein
VALFCGAALGWSGEGAASVLDIGVLTRMQRLGQLTPDDFADVVRRVRALRL